MNDRLRQFLAMEGLSPAQFSQLMGIQRSGVSHLLNGRNKPSYEFIEKMLTSFPDLDPEWLILGKGRPYKSNRPVPEISGNPDLFAETGDSDTDDEEDFYTEDQLLTAQNTLSQAAENPKIETPAASTSEKQGRSIARIIVFFNDGTYEER